MISSLRTRCIRVLASIALTVGAVPAAQADDWGCQVLLCLANPAGPTAVAQCVPPIAKLWAALSKIPSDPFPTCPEAGAANKATTAYNAADLANCPPDWLQQLGSDTQPRLICGARGMITVSINGTVLNRTWYRLGGGVYTFQGSGAANTQLTPPPDGGIGGN